MFLKFFCLSLSFVLSINTFASKFRIADFAEVSNIAESFRKSFGLGVNIRSVEISALNQVIILMGKGNSRSRLIVDLTKGRPEFVETNHQFFEGKLDILRNNQAENYPAEDFLATTGNIKLRKSDDQFYFSIGSSMRNDLGQDMRPFQLPEVPFELGLKKDQELVTAYFSKGIVDQEIILSAIIRDKKTGTHLLVKGKVRYREDLNSVKLMAPSSIVVGDSKIFDVKLVETRPAN